MHVHQQRAGTDDLHHFARAARSASATSAARCPAAPAYAHELTTVTAALHETDCRRPRDEAAGGDRGGLHRRGEHTHHLARGEGSRRGRHNHGIDLLGVAGVGVLG